MAPSSSTGNLSTNGDGLKRDEDENGDDGDDGDKNDDENNDDDNMKEDSGVDLPPGYLMIAQIPEILSGAFEV